jgi:hypothetical protein
MVGKALDKQQITSSRMRLAEEYADTETYGERGIEKEEFIVVSGAVAYLDGSVLTLLQFEIRVWYSGPSRNKVARVSSSSQSFEIGPNLESKIRLMLSRK